MSLKFLYQMVFYGHEIGQSAKKLTNLWCTITFAFSQVASRQKNSANSQNTNLAIILWHCNFTIFHMSWAYFSYFKCFINCIEYHILVSSTICCSLLTKAKGEFPLLLTGFSGSNLTVDLWTRGLSSMDYQKKNWVLCHVWGHFQMFHFKCKTIENSLKTWHMTRFSWDTFAFRPK